MNSKKILHKLATQKDQSKRLHKIAGLKKRAGKASEIAGTLLNPLNLYGGSQIGLLASAITKHRTKKEQLATEGDLWKNLLIPGYGPYNWGKRGGRFLDTDIDRIVEDALDKGGPKALTKLVVNHENEAVRNRAAEYLQSLKDSGAFMKS